MVGLDGVNDSIRLLVLPGQIHADGDVAALHLVVDSLADVVEEARTLGGVHIHAQLRGHKTGNVGHFDGVIQHVLAVAGAVAHAAQKLDQLGIEAVDIGLKHGTLAFGLDGGIDLALGFGHHFLDAGGVDTAVLNQLFQRKTRNFPADRVKAGNCDGLGGVVDNQVAAGQRLDAANVAAFAADDAALHLVVGERDDGDGDFAGVIGGAALNGSGDDFAGALVRLVLELGLDFLDLHGHFVGHIILHIGDDVSLGLFHGESGDFLQHFQLAFLDQRDLGLLGLGRGDLVGQGLALFFQRVSLAIQGLLLLLKAAFLLLHLAAALLFLPLVLGAAFVYFFLCLYESFSLLALGTLDCII